MPPPPLFKFSNPIASPLTANPGSAPGHTGWRVKTSTLHNTAQIARFMGPTWSPPGSCRPQMGPMLAPWTLLSGWLFVTGIHWCLVDSPHQGPVMWKVCSCHDIVMQSYWQVVIRYHSNQTANITQRYLCNGSQFKLTHLFLQKFLFMSAYPDDKTTRI